ncbi:hypothetical protein [Streptomyces sp. NPDC018610]|uniref:hypothetical protein n=1 Tax=Streptomyces sp. NPDC018610 TaxID=3365049 RepID=UPI0037980CFF
MCIGKDGAGPAGGRFGRAKAMVKVGGGVLVAATTVGVFAWKKYKGLQEEHEELQAEHEGLRAAHEGLLSMAAGLVVQLAESAAENEILKSENDYLKSATGAAKTLKSFDC